MNLGKALKMVTVPEPVDAAENSDAPIPLPADWPRRLRIPIVVIKPTDPRQPAAKPERGDG